MQRKAIHQRRATESALPRCPSGIEGLDEITGGGLPRGRPTLVCGNAGCGKTLLGMEFLVRGAAQFNEPGVFMAFEETAEDLASNFASLGFDLDGLVARNKLVIDYVRIERSEIEETGEYNLDGLFIRLGMAIDAVKAKRVVLDTIEALFSGLPNPLILRAELRRLFRWLKDRGVTAIITGERGETTLTRQGLEEYVSDCVITLDHRVVEEIATRRLRVVKYRGAAHGTNEYPFLIGDRGMVVLPITALGLAQRAPTERVSTGIDRLDTMLDGRGFYRGSTILVTGTAGTGKTSVAAQFVDAACRRGERCLYFAFEESQGQIMRNMRSIGIDLAQWADAGLLTFHATRPSTFGLEMHLAAMHDEVRRRQPRVVIVDPISNLAVAGGGDIGIKSMLMRLMDYLKGQEITTMFTVLSRGDNLEHTEAAISSLADTWLLLRDIELAGERNRGIYVLKSRGMKHSNQIREFILTDAGVKLLDVYVGPGGVLTGSSRIRQEAQDREEQALREQELDRRKHELERKRQALEMQITTLRKDLEAEEAEFERFVAEKQLAGARIAEEQLDMARSRKADDYAAAQRPAGEGGVR